MRTLLIKNLQLIRKDLFIMIAFGIIVPPFLLSQINDKTGTLQYIMYCVMIFVFVIVAETSISMSETADQKAITYLCSLPIRRNDFLIEKYITDGILIALYSLIFVLESQVFNVIKQGKPWVFFCLLVPIIIYRCILIPLEFKFGYQKIKTISSFFVVLFPFAISIAAQKVDFNKVKLDWILDEKAKTVLISSIIMAAFITISVYIASNIFSRKEL